ncbi:nucleotide exchange factor Sil1 [Anopheles aquasalis]|uniref:nucleotide exchange factor Sil1 n=1 Tax=Anopheles aquasalis TaxID=42839 RepID=UPI00215AF19D|nr:nucleotide exchange factor Sil1 [Anopheles aquasalis]
MPKMKPIYVLHCFFAVMVIASATAPNDSLEKSKFVATNEWQEIAEGQGIPPGLHVRINLSTGKKEAKLLDAESASETTATDAQGGTESAISLVPGQEVEDHGSPQPAAGGSLGGMNLEAIKEALRDIPATDYKPEDATVSGRYKSYSQIKQELKDANVELQTDSEIMGTLLDRFAKSVSNEQPELDALFEDLQYLAHQIDNALEFIDRGGVEQIIWPSLNRTGEQQQRVRVQALTLLGTLAQNNPKAKVSLFERDASAKLLAALGRATASEEISAAFYAFGSLVRKFPFAQTRLLTPHGYSLLYDVWTKPVVELKVKVKALQLVADVVVDYLSVTTDRPAGNSPPEQQPVDAVTVEQYRSTRLTEGLEKTEFCKHAGQFFQAHRAALVADEHLTDETVRALRSCRTLCQPLWSECALFRHTLLVLRNNLDNRLSDDPDLVEYRTEIQLNIDDFLRELYGNNGKPKDEL